MCRDLFEQLDKDESGGISMKELGHGLKELGYVVSQVCQSSTGISCASFILMLLLSALEDGTGTDWLAHCCTGGAGEGHVAHRLER